MSSSSRHGSQHEGSQRREYPERPIAGVGSVVLRRVAGRRQVVLARRKAEPMAGCWSLPGGAMELGETVREACIRETMEETGLRVDPIAVVEPFDIIQRDAEGRVQYHYLVVDFLCHLRGDESEGEARAGSDVGEVVWADVQGVLEEGDFALTARACTVIRRALEMEMEWDEGEV
ncbi:MAG: NUDIX hydrolase [Acidobacteriaceae bacterium]